ncbi:MAG: hypothetical protein LBG15_10075 [Dysgonamonadaceae bacterium]|jgi:uncharacterized protein YlzI (FlbEa/FlbD family)|nr:hypothetical protein [Dysgonamonadaceae bacterium]
MDDSSHKNKITIAAINNSPDTVFRLIDVSMLTSEDNFNSINQKLNYYVRTGKILCLRRGIYSKLKYSCEEVANKIYTPSYVSLEYVLVKNGIISQDSETLTSACYLSRQIKINDQTFSYHKFKRELLVNLLGVQRIDSVNIANPERAFLDLLYLNKEYDFNNLDKLNRTVINQILPIYKSNKLSSLIKKLLKND